MIQNGRVGSSFCLQKGRSEWFKQCSEGGGGAQQVLRGTSIVMQGTYILAILGGGGQQV